MSKRKDRIALAKTRPAIETEKLRIRERTKIPSSKARFLPRYTKAQIIARRKKEKEHFQHSTIDTDDESVVPS